MVRHYLNRRDIADSSDEDFSYISELDSRVEFKDVMDVEDRYISLGKHIPQRKKLKKPPLQATKEGIRWALDAAGNTGQYIKFVNMTIDKRQTEIDKIKTLQNKFDNEVQMLSSQKIEKLDLSTEGLAGPDVDTITEYLNQLLLDKRIAQNKFKSLKTDLDGMEKDLKSQEEEIEQVRSHLKAKIIQSSGSPVLDVESAIKVIRQELTAISEKYDVSKISEAMNLVLSSKPAQ